jgi:hypothetical protein
MLKKQEQGQWIQLLKRLPSCQPWNQPGDIQLG